MSSSDQLPRHPGNPSDDYPPTRPGPLLVVAALVVVVAGVSIENWSDISAHVPQIAKALGL